MTHSGVSAMSLRQVEAALRPLLEAHRIVF